MTVKLSLLVMNACSGKQIICDMEKRPAQCFGVTMDTKLLALLDKKVIERKVRSRSEAITEAVNCWIYREDDNCESCPYFEPEEEAKK